MLDQIGDVPGVVRCLHRSRRGLPQYRLEIDRTVAARYGLNVADVGCGRNRLGG